jgi:hypothetical protein
LLLLLLLPLPLLVLTTKGSSFCTCKVAYGQ